MGHRSEQAPCRVEQAVNAALDQTLAEAEALVLSRLRAVTLAELSLNLPHGAAGAHGDTGHAHSTEAEP
ncbi:hypothetical protein D3C87_2180120 [compost metagenome]